MPGTNVAWPLPMTQWPTLWASQMGVPGTDDNRVMVDGDRRSELIALGGVTAHQLLM